MRTLIAAVLILLAFSLFTTGFAQTADRDTAGGHAIAPLVDARAAEADAGAIGGLGATLANELTALFLQYKPAGSTFEIVRQEIITMAMDEAGMDLLGIVKHQQAADIGEIIGADYVWYGTYRIYGGRISVQLNLWSLHTGGAVPETVARIDDYIFVEDSPHIRAISCSLFERMYEKVIGHPIETGCAAGLPTGIQLPPVVVVEVPFFSGQLLSSASIRATSMRLGAVNNLIEFARQTEGLVMADMEWGWSAGLRSGYSFMGGIEALLSVDLLAADAHAGTSGNVSISLTATGVMTGLAYHLRILGTEILVEVQGGWQGAQLIVVDHWDTLDCPAQVAASGIGYKASVSVHLPLSAAFGLTGVIGYRVADLATASMRLPRLDLSGLSLGAGVSLTLGEGR